MEGSKFYLMTSSLTKKGCRVRFLSFGSHHLGIGLLNLDLRITLLRLRLCLCLIMLFFLGFLVLLFRCRLLLIWRCDPTRCSRTALTLRAVIVLDIGLRCLFLVHLRCQHILQLNTVLVDNFVLSGLRIRGVRRQISLLLS